MRMLVLSSLIDDALLDHAIARAERALADVAATA